MKFQRMEIDPPRLYWTSRKTDFDRDIWFEKSPGCCGRIWFPFAEPFMVRFPWLAVRTFWLMIKFAEAWNMFVSHYPPVCPNFFVSKGERHE